VNHRVGGGLPRGIDFPEPAMPRAHRRTAPKVRNGRVQKQNNWRRTPGLFDARPHLTIRRERPGPGHRHVLFQRDIERVIELIPDWEELSRGVNVILLDGKRTDCDGWYNRGIVALTAWPREMSYSICSDWYVGHKRFLDRIGLRVSGPPDDLTGHWTDATVRAYQLLHVFLHELGHHRDRMMTRSQRWPERGEEYAEQYAWAYEEQLWERYVAEFGWPAA
jgi:hypothetical protein